MNENTLKKIRYVTWVGFWVNAALMVLKLFFGYYGHSDALVADGYHSLSDFATDFIVLFCVGMAYKRPDAEHPYGHGKYETLASLLIAAILFGVAVGIGYSGVATIVGFFRGIEIPRPDIWTLLVALLSIGAKEWMYRYTYRTGDELGSSVLKTNAWHHRSDALSSVATLIGVGMAFFLGEKYRIFDPIASIIIGILIAYSAVKMAMPSVGELLEMSIPAKQLHAVEKAIRECPGVVRYHSLRARRNGHSYVVDVNIHVDPQITVAKGHEIATRVEQRLREILGRDLIIYVHTEPENACTFHEPKGNQSR